VRGIRRHLAAVFGVWLLCHACALAAAPLSMCVSLPRNAPDAACACGHAGSTGCPMHHREHAKSNSDCACRSTSDGGMATLASLLGPVAVVSLEVQVEPRVVSTTACVAVSRSIVPAPAVPEPPPPRA